MDPDAALVEINRLVVEVADAVLSGVPARIIEAALSLAERVVDLHDWLSNGGFLPEAWSVPMTNEPTTKEKTDATGTQAEPDQAG